MSDDDGDHCNAFSADREKAGDIRELGLVFSFNFLSEGNFSMFFFPISTIKNDKKILCEFFLPNFHP